MIPEFKSITGLSFSWICMILPPDLQDDSIIAQENQKVKNKRNSAIFLENKIKFYRYFAIKLQYVWKTCISWFLRKMNALSGISFTASNVCVATQTICDESQILIRGSSLKPLFPEKSCIFQVKDLFLDFIFYHRTKIGESFFFLRSIHVHFVHFCD